MTINHGFIFDAEIPEHYNCDDVGTTLDEVFKKALSIPGVLDHVGNPKVGDLCSWIIVNREKLLVCISDSLLALEDQENPPSLSSLVAVFTQDGKTVLEISVGMALSYLLHDHYRNKDGDWSRADTVTIRVRKPAQMSDANRVVVESL
jgi:hypothetical protein